MPSSVCLRKICLLTAVALFCCAVDIAHAKKHERNRGNSKTKNVIEETSRRHDRRLRKSVKSTTSVKNEDHNKYTNESTITVKLDKGRYRGRVEQVLDRKVAFFLGMRYAEAPLEDMRFKKAKPVKKWGTRHAMDYPNTCYQWRDNTFGPGYAGTEMWNANTNVSEDCLYMNVWTPLRRDFAEKRLGSERPLLPVMVWIYGGGFYSGTSSLDVYQGQWLAAAEEVVVVSMNYRIGAFGFLTFGNEHAPGNTGLWDQQLALLWIKENIHHFRGDPNRITLFGESAGAASISLHMVSEKSKGLFQNAIIQSASAVSPWAILPMKEMKKRANRLAEIMNCTVKSNDSELDEVEMMKCLYKADPQKLVDEEMNMADLGTARFQDAAVIDDDFLTEEAVKKLKSGKIQSDVNMLGGFNGNEGNYFLVYGTEGFTDIHNDVPITYGQYRRGLNRSLWGYPWQPFDNEQVSVETGGRLIMDAIDFQYLNYEASLRDKNQCRLANDDIICEESNQPSLNNYKYTLDQITGDLNFVCPVIKFIREVDGNPITNSEGSGEDTVSERKASSHGKRFMYRFLPRSSQTPWPEWMGTLHGYEIEFAFGIPLNKNINYTEQEVELSRIMLKYWANFARSGNPNSPSDEAMAKLPLWPQYTKDKEAVMILSIEQSDDDQVPTAVAYAEEGTKSKDCTFWNYYYSVLLDNVDQLDNTACGCESKSGASITTSTSIITLAYCSILTFSLVHLLEFF